MTLAEVQRAILSKRRQEEARLQEHAYFDYNLANLIGVSVGRLHSKSNKMPDITEVYPKLFNQEKLEEEKQKQKVEKSANNFKRFAEAFNAKHKKEVANK